VELQKFEIFTVAQPSPAKVDHPSIAPNAHTPPAPAAEWHEFPVTLTPAASCDTAVLQIGVRGSGTVWFDQISLVPRSWQAAGGF